MTIELDQIIDGVVEDIYKAYPEILERFGEEGRKRCREDNTHHFNNLEVAYKVQDVQIFLEYANWLNRLLTSRGMKTEHITDNFARIKVAIEGKGQDGKESFYQECLKQAISLLNQA